MYVSLIVYNRHRHKTGNCLKLRYLKNCQAFVIKFGLSINFERENIHSFQFCSFNLDSMILFSVSEVIIPVHKIWIREIFIRQMLCTALLFAISNRLSDLGTHLKLWHAVPKWLAEKHTRSTRIHFQITFVSITCRIDMKYVCVLNPSTGASVRHIIHALYISHFIFTPYFDADAVSITFVKTDIN